MKKLYFFLSAFLLSTTMNAQNQTGQSREAGEFSVSNKLKASGIIKDYRPEKSFTAVGSVHKNSNTSGKSVSGCTEIRDANNPQWPTETYVPHCLGVPESVTKNVAYTGEYSVIQVTQGTEYTFSDSKPTYFTTITNEDASEVIIAGTGALKWTATYSGLIRFYSHIDSNCNSELVTHDRQIQCGVAAADPQVCSDFKVPSNNIEDGLLLSGFETLATDIPMGDQDFTIYGISPSMMSYQVPATTFTFTIYDDVNGLPGNQIATRTGTITGSEAMGTFYGVIDVAKYNVLFDSPLDLKAHTKYWIQLDSDTYGWEVTTATRLGAVDVYNQGTGWRASEQGYNMVFDLICDAPAVGGCLEGNKLGNVYTPQCIGLPEKVNTLQWAGDYVTINVTKGTEYTFSSSVTTDYITIGDENGTTALASGTSPVTWTADADRVIRMYLHKDENCTTENVIRTSYVQCGAVLPPPANDEVEGAIAVSCGSTEYGSTLYANNSGGNLSNDVFYTYKGDGTSKVVTLSLCGSGYDTLIRVFSDAALTNQIVFDDNSCLTDTEFFTSKLSFLDDGVSTYYIMVEGYDSSGFWYTPDSGNYVLAVTCEDMPEPPVHCEDFVVASNNLENAAAFGGPYEQRLAADIPVGNEGFTISGISPNVAGKATKFSFIFYKDNGGLPGDQWETREGTIVEETPLGSNFGLDFYTYKVAFDSPLTFEPNTTYWVEMNTDATHWEVRSLPYTHMGYGDAVMNVLIPGMWRSTNGLAECVFKLECDGSMATANSTKNNFQYYPNPVNDILNISADQKITSVSLYNVAGQKVINNVKANDGKVNVSRLTSGTYIVTAILENGKTETFKVIKK